MVGSFTKLGFEARRRMFDWQDLNELRLDGTVVVITGGNSGLGLLTATRLASMGASIRIVARDPERGEAARRGRSRPRGPATRACTSAICRRWRRCGRWPRAIVEGESRLDVLIHNAGGLLPERKVSEDGHEVTFATMVLGPFMLTRALVPLLSSTPEQSRAVDRQRRHVHPVAGRRRARDDARGLQGGDRLRPGQAGASRAERGVGEAAARGRVWWCTPCIPDGPTPPGLEVGLPGFRTVLGPLLRTPDEGADTIVWLAAAEEPGRSTGKFWLDRAPRSTDEARAVGRDPGRARPALDHARASMADEA